MERKGLRKRILSLLMVLSMVVATWIGAVPSQTVVAAAKPALNKVSVDVLVGKSVKLKLKKKIAKAKVNWKSKNKKIAKVNKNGKVVGVKQGNTRVTANVTVKGKKYPLNCKVRVVKKASELQITYDDGKTTTPIQLKVGEGVSLEAKVVAPKNSNDFVKSWKSSDDEVVTVSETGEVSAVKVGDATVTATTFGKAKATIAVKVAAAIVTRPSAPPTVSTTPVPTNKPSATPNVTKEPTTLKEAYKDLFLMGTAVRSAHLTDAGQSNKLDHVLENYDSITMENEMKPEAILGSRGITNDVSFDRSKLPEGYTDEQVPKLNFATVDACLAVARDKGLKMRGHTLVWHSQTPAWFFREGYVANGALVTPEVMDARMEFYIKSVLEHVQTEFPGVIYSWDVCNEVFSNNGALNYESALRGANPSGGERSDWYNVYKSDEFVIKAFTYAKKYVEDGVTLLYNDYNEYTSNKTNNIVTLANKLYDLGMETIGESLIDGIGMQSHLDVRYPEVGVVKKAVEKFATIGDGSLEIQLTELDVTINFNGATGFTLDQQTTYYADLMEMIVDLRRNEGFNITAVTFWGFYDEMSWRSAHTPLLLNYNVATGFVKKGAWMSVMNAPLTK